MQMPWTNNTAQTKNIETAPYTVDITEWLAQHQHPQQHQPYSSNATVIPMSHCTNARAPTWDKRHICLNAAIATTTPSQQQWQCHTSANGTEAPNPHRCQLYNMNATAVLTLQLYQCCVTNMRTKPHLHQCCHHHNKQTPQQWQWHNTTNATTVHATAGRTSTQSTANASQLIRYTMLLIHSIKHDCILSHQEKIEWKPEHESPAMQCFRTMKRHCASNHVPVICKILNNCFKLAL
jgi:hypothetical protein